MKKLLLILLLVCSASAWAQDVIVKRDGSTILCRVVEVNKTEVVYKRWGNLEGPNYVMNLSDLSAINYENGKKIRMDETQKSENIPSTTTSTPLPTVQTNTGQQTVSDDALLKMMVKPALTPSQKKAKKLKLIGYIGGPALVIAGAALIVVGTGEETGGDCFGGGAACIASGIALTSGCLIRAHNLKKKANSQYSVQSSPLYQHDFTLKNGTSFSAGVDMLKDNTRHNPTLGVGLTYNF